MIYDCFIFCNELMMLEIRLNELYPFVDKFVLVESTHTFAGKEKPLYYDQVKDSDVFSKFRDKIIHLVYHMVPRSNRWENEYNQRNYIKMGILEAKPHDIIIVSDVDEIINTEVFPKINKCFLPSRLEMKNCGYFFNCCSETNWFKPSFCRFVDYRSAQFLRNLDYHISVIKKAGWHFAYLMSPDQISKKMEMFSHSEFDNDYYKDVNRIQKCIDKNKSFFNDNYVYPFSSIELPKYITNNIDRYKKFIKG